MTQAQALTLKLNLAQEREFQGGSSSQRSLRALSGSGESQSPGSTPPLVLQSGSQTVICTWITWGSAKLKILPMVPSSFIKRWWAWTRAYGIWSELSLRPSPCPVASLQGLSAPPPPPPCSEVYLSVRLPHKTALSAGPRAQLPHLLPRCF